MATQKKKILIVEDEKSMARALKLKLEKEGFDPVVAQNGNEAKKKVEAETFDLVLLDLIMPKMDGFAFLKQIKGQEEKKTPVIVLSNLSQPEDKEKALDAGASAYYIKSNITIIQVIEEVKRFLKGA